MLIFFRIATIRLTSEFKVEDNNSSFYYQSKSILSELIRALILSNKMGATKQLKLSSSRINQTGESLKSI